MHHDALVPTYYGYHGKCLIKSVVNKVSTLAFSTPSYQLTCLTQQPGCACAPPLLPGVFFTQLLVEGEHVP